MFRSYLKIAQKRVMMVFMKSIRYFFCAFILLGIYFLISSKSSSKFSKSAIYKTKSLVSPTFFNISIYSSLLLVTT